MKRCPKSARSGHHARSGREGLADLSGRAVAGVACPLSQPAGVRRKVLCCRLNARLEHNM